MNKNQKGFSIVEGLLILIIVGLIGFIGWYVWHSKQTSDKSLSAANKISSSTTTNQIANPYAGWKSYTLKYEKSNFKYPRDWTVTDKSQLGNTDTSGRLIQTPGQDILRITSGRALEVYIYTGYTSYDFGSPNVNYVAPTKLSTLGSTYYLSFVSTDGTLANVTGAQLASSSVNTYSVSQFVQSKNIKLGPGATDNPAIQDVPHPFNLIGVQEKDTHRTYSVNDYQEDTDFKTALNIIKSMSY